MASNQKIESEAIEPLNKLSHDLDALYFEQLQVHDLLRLAGNAGRFQKSIIAILSVISFIMAFVVFMLPFVFYRPNFYCFDENKNAFLCEEKIACENKFGFETRSDKFSAIDQFKLYCENSSKETLAKSVIFFAVATPTLFLSAISDVLGRRPILFISSAALLIGATIAFFSSSFQILVFATSLCFIGSDIFFSISTIYTNELIGSKMRNKANGITFFFYGLGDIAFFLLNIGIRDYKTIYLMLMFLGCLSLALTFLLIETPFIFHKQMKVKQLFVNLCEINARNFPLDFERQKKNQRQIHGLIFQEKFEGREIEQTPEITLNKASENARGNFWAEYKDIPLKTFLRIFLLSLIMVNIYIGYGMTVLVPESMGIDNIYLNGVLLGISELVGYLSIILLAHKIPRRLLNVLNSASLIGFSCLLLYLSLFDFFFSPVIKKVIESIIAVVMKLIICMNFTLIFNYCAELVETKIRGFSLGYTVFCGRASTSFCSVLERFCRERALHPMIASALPAFFALPASLVLPETLNRPMKN